LSTDGFDARYDAATTVMMMERCGKTHRVNMIADR